MITHKVPESVPSSSGKINIGDKERMASAVGGVLLLASAVRIGKERPAAAIGSTLAALYLLFRGSTGHCYVGDAIGRDTASEERASNSLVITEFIRVNRPKEQVYDFWRKLENLPRFMTHLKDVKQTSKTESHWEAHIPGGIGSISWDAQIIDDRPNKMISWRSKKGALVDNAGEVTFTAVGEHATEIHAVISYTPPAGAVGYMAAKWLNKSIEDLIRADLRKFGHMIETTRLVDNA